MKRLGVFLTAALLLAPGPSEGQGWLPRAGTLPATFQGPGDVLGTGWIWWFGLRAFSAATAGTKAANICNASDANCADVNTLTNGNFDVATATGAPLNCGGTGGTCTIKTLYDKSGNTNCTTACDYTQATIGNRPTLVFNCINTTLPCIRWSGGGSTGKMSSPNSTISLSQPFSLSIVYNSTNIATFADVISNTAVLFDFASGANTSSLFAGSFANFTAADGVFHAVQATWNNAASTNTVNMDGTLSSPAPGTNTVVSGNAWVFGSASNFTPSGDFGEAGWNSAGFTGTQQTNLCHNQRLYWATGGSC